MWKNKLSQDDYFIFGVSYGECIGDCVTYYKIQNDILYSDFMETSGQELNIDNQNLSNTNYLQAKALFEELPEYLNENANQTLVVPIVWIKERYILNNQLMEPKPTGILILMLIRFLRR